jgi:hypothetical protein
MEPVPPAAGKLPPKQILSLKFPLYLGEPRPLRSFSGGRRSSRKFSFFPLALLSAGALCLPALTSVSSGAESETNNAAATVSPADVQSLRDEIRELREEVKALKGSTATNAVTLKEVSDKVKDSASHAEVEEVRDLEDENVLRSIGSTSSLNAYQVGGIGGGPGYLHLVNLSGSAQLGYTSLLGPNNNPPSTANAASTQESFKLSSISLALSGYARQDPGTEGDVRFNVGVLGTPYRYIGTGNTSLSAANSTPTSGANGTYLNASDVWVAYDVKTTKLELEPLWTLSLQFGQFLTPYGVDNPSTENNRPTINQAQYVSKLGLGRDIGVQAVGGIDNRNDPSASTIPLIGYNFGVFNGSGPNTFDNNGGVDALARLTYNPFYQYAQNFRNLQFAGNILVGNIGGNSDQLPTKLRYGGDIQWLRKPFLLTAEYVHSEDGYDGSSVSPLGTAYPTALAPFAKSDSFVGTLFWTPPTLPDYQPWIRVDYLKPKAFNNYTGSTLASANAGGYGNAAKTAYSIGFNWFIWQKNPVTRLTYSSMQTERVLKLQADYTYFDLETAGASAGLAKSQIDVLLTLSF